MDLFSRPRPGPQALSAYLGRQITMAVTDSHGPGNKPEISLFIGMLVEFDGSYKIVAADGKEFRIPGEWLSKAKPMDDKIRSLLGGSDVLLPVTKSEFESAGFTFQRDPIGQIDVQVRR